MTAYRNYVLGLLTLLLMFNFVDRFALGVVLQDIKSDLDLTDTQLGLLTGLAFALFYSVMGIPIARWADRGNRVTIIALTAALWSGALALCGMAKSFTQLLLVRVGVAVGEAGGFPPGLSLISDYFDRPQRPRAIAIYTLGGPLSVVVGYLLAGWLSEAVGWRVMFVILGIPGLVLAVLARLTIREPRLTLASPSVAAALAPMPGIDSKTTAPGVQQPPFTEVAAYLWRNATFRQLLLCLSVQFFFIYGILQWLPAFFMRSYGLTAGQVGVWFAMTWGIGGIVGNYLGGALTSRYAAQNERLQLLAIAGTMALCAVLSTSIYLLSDFHVAFACLAIASLLLFTANGPVYATLQALVPERMRAVSVALLLMFANLIGMGLGPLAAGVLSDALRPWAQEESLRYALLILSPGYLWVGWHAWRASRTVTRDLVAVSA